MIISRAPVHISFLGGGTDYPEYFLQEGGAVLATAIDKFSYVTASPFLSRLFDYSVRVSYRKVELAKQVSEIEHNVFRESLRFCGLERDIELHTVADVPAFTGLGSFSTFTVALLHVLHGFKGEFLRPQELAAEAIHVERHILQENVGCQGQVLAAFGGFNLIEFRTESDFSVHPVPLSPVRMTELERHLLLVFTGIKREPSGVVASQLKRVRENTRALRSLRAMAHEGFDLLVGGRPWREFGQLLHRAWEAKRSLDDGISSPEIDELYARGIQAGAWGGKLLGAGGGGFLLFFAPEEAHSRLAAVFPEHPLLRAKMNAPGSQIIFS